jgi:hypothetical protein
MYRDFQTALVPQNFAVRRSHSLRAEQYGDRFPIWTTFIALVQAGLGAHAGSLSEV